MDSWITLSLLNYSHRKRQRILAEGGPDVVLANPELSYRIRYGRGAGELFPKPIPFEKLEGWKVKVAEAKVLARKIAVIPGEVSDESWMLLGAKDPNELGNLLKAPSPPLIAFMRGESSLLKRKPSVAIVGSRRPTDAGKRRARILGEKLTRAGFLVVSGGAYGVDLCAHEGALAAGGDTLAILGEAFPLSPSNLPPRLREHVGGGSEGGSFAYLSTFAPGTRVFANHFVIRNQYIASLANEVIMVEGTATSGALHTLEFAREMGLGCWTIPGGIDDPLYAGNNQLLAEQHARAIVDVDKFISDLAGKHFDFKILEEKRGPVSTSKKEPVVHTEVTRLMQKNGCRITLDDLCDALKWPIFKAQEELLDLELDGRIHKEGPHYVLC